MKIKNRLIILIPLLAALVTSCQNEDAQPDPTVGLTKIAEGIATDAEAKVVVWAKTDLFVGYNKLFIELFDSKSGARISESNIQFHPLMTMDGGMTHSCPTEDPSEVAVGGLFDGSISFVMPSSGLNTWALTVYVHNLTNNLEGEVALAIQVTQPDPVAMKSFTTSGGAKYFVSYYFPEPPKVGINEIHILVNSKESMMSWPAATGLTMSMDPEMVSMGHGSPNNVNPTLTASGHYVGQVNFTMTGDWRINLTLSEDDILLQDLYFDLEI